MVNTLAVDNEAKQTIEALQTELQKANEKLQAVEELKNRSADAGTLVDSYISGKIVQLKEQIATLEKREERLLWMIISVQTEFQLHVSPCNQFMLKVMMKSSNLNMNQGIQIFCSQPEISRQFQDLRNRDSLLLPLGTWSFGRFISTQVDVFIRKLNSIPAFTANLTVESFNKRTLA